MLDVVLQVAHQHQITGLVPARVQSVVVDVAEDSAGTDAVGAVLGVDELAETVHDDSAVLPLALLLVLLGLNSTQRKTRLSTSLSLIARHCISTNALTSRYTPYYLSLSY